MTTEEINGYLEERDLTALLMDGYEEALVGISFDDYYEDDKGNYWARPIYDFEKCIESLIINEGMSIDEALDHFSYNTLRALEYEPRYKRPIIIELLGGY